MARAGNVRRVEVEVPEGLQVPPSELEERIRIELALRLYEKGIASLGQAQDSRVIQVGFLGVAG